MHMKKAKSWVLKEHEIYKQKWAGSEQEDNKEVHHLKRKMELNQNVECFRDWVVPVIE